MKVNRSVKIATILAITLLLLAATFFLLANNTDLSNPESIAYDAKSNRFFISSAGNSTIVAMDSLGNLHDFIKEGLDKPRGLKLQSSTLYVTDQTRLKGFDINSGKKVFELALQGAKMLNDVEADAQGLLYVSDTRANILFIVDTASKKVEPLTSQLMKSPNGIYYDHPRKQLFIVCFTERSPILSFSIPNRSFDVFKETMYSELDGITCDDLGRIYFSSWKEKTIYRIPQEQNRFEIFKSDIESPADIYFHDLTGEIIVPVFDKNKIERLKTE